jgi:hypothetical protein
MVKVVLDRAMSNCEVRIEGTFLVEQASPPTGILRYLTLRSDKKWPLRRSLSLSSDERDDNLDERLASSLLTPHMHASKHERQQSHVGVLKCLRCQSSHSKRQEASRIPNDATT